MCYNTFIKLSFGGIIMKKTLSVILALVMMLSVFTVCAFAMESPEETCEHVWSKKATCVEDGHFFTCKLCGAESEIEAHDYSKYVCAEDGHLCLCKYCGAEGEIEAHDFNEYVCVEDGHSLACKCGEISEVVEAHNFGDYVYDENASFVKNGTETATCAECGATTSRFVDNTAGYVTRFADYEFLYVIFDLIGSLLMLISNFKGVTA